MEELRVVKLIDGKLVVTDGPDLCLDGGFANSVYLVVECADGGDANGN